MRANIKINLTEATTSVHVRRPKICQHGVHEGREAEKAKKMHTNVTDDTNRSIHGRAFPSERY